MPRLFFFDLDESLLELSQYLEVTLDIGYGLFLDIELPYDLFLVPNETRMNGTDRRVYSIPPKVHYFPLLICSYSNTFTKQTNIAQLELL